MTIKVLMFPDPKRIRNETNGIAQVVLNYGKYASQFDIEYVSENDSYDVVAVHAGMQQTAKQENLVCHCHGLYWTGDRPGADWEYSANENVINSIRSAKEITVPSHWVAQTFRRDMHLSPHVVSHGINWAEWQHNEEDGRYVLYNKNRETTTCNSSDVSLLAKNFPSIHFVTTFGEQLDNVSVIGVLPFQKMRKVIQSSSVYLAIAKETGGIGILEAMASGKPVLGYKKGAICDFVQHGVNGYLAESKEDLLSGLVYCTQNRDVLGDNGRELAKKYSWENSVAQIADIYQLATQEQSPTVSIIIPCYNYSGIVGRAIECSINQSYNLIENIIIVDDGSSDGTKNVVSSFIERDNRIRYIYQQNAGVANARNNGIQNCNSKYICCLDADDQILPDFIASCVAALEEDRRVGIAYTKLKLTNREGTRTTRKASDWPTEFDYNEQIIGKNQVPTCCVFRRDVWERLGGFRQRYAPKGCGSEDAEFWLRVGAAGYSAKLATSEPLFIYTLGGGGTTGDPSYVEIDWLFWHPWTRDHEHPFASVATPAKKSHNVRSYDEPVVSIIVPVGPGHEENVVNALDSIEGQTFRKWEMIVVWDSKDTSKLEQYKQSYPYARFIVTEGETGAGHARNIGVMAATASLITFLDADDWFYPQMIQKQFEAYNESGGDVAIYTDSVGKALLDEETVAKAKPGKVLFYNKSTKETVISQKNLPYDWNEAVKQPNSNAMYIWCYISTLHPKEWFYEVGGFDESMVSWEDWDYWLRLSFLGKCFIHLEEELMVYPYTTGNRREKGRNEWNSLVAYMKEKYERIEKMPCKSCGQRYRPPVRPVSPPAASPFTPSTVDRSSTNERASMFNFDNDMVLVDYITTQRGDHNVVGHAKFDVRLPGLKMVNVNGLWQIVYGYHGGGDRFLVHRSELQFAPHLFRAVSTMVPEITIASQKKQEKAPPPQPVRVQKILQEELESATDDPVIPLSKPKPIVEDVLYDLQTLPGVSADIAKQLKDAGIDTPQDILELGIDGLKGLKGVGPHRAELIFTAIQKRLLNEPK